MQCHPLKCSGAHHHNKPRHLESWTTLWTPPATPCMYHPYACDLKSSRWVREIPIACWNSLARLAPLVYLLFLPDTSMNPAHPFRSRCSYHVAFGPGHLEPGRAPACHPPRGPRSRHAPRSPSPSTTERGRRCTKSRTSGWRHAGPSESRGCSPPAKGLCQRIMHDTNRCAVAFIIHQDIPWTCTTDALKPVPPTSRRNIETPPMCLCNIQTHTVTKTLTLSQCP